uniref:Uncharacterized protein n=1 Tax=Arundo donax TaxID=35708 RepID=A0A0A9HDJ5_ARUDO
MTFCLILVEFDMIVIIEFICRLTISHAFHLKVKSDIAIILLSLLILVQKR